MTRKAIIIGNNVGKDAPTFLKGVDFDLTNYQNYLISQGGGSWFDLFEIQILHNKNRSEILSAIRNCDCEYAFVVFTGHGYYKTNDNLTYVCVADGEISEDELRVRSSIKQSLILDCCREKITVQTSSQYRNFTGNAPAMENLPESFSNRNLTKGITLSKSISSNNFNSKVVNRLSNPFRIINNSRNKFDKALISTSNGLFTGYACQIDQTSSDNPSSGGAFSSAFINTGKQFSSQNAINYFMEIDDAISQTRAELAKDPLTTQVPEFVTKPTYMSQTAPFAITNTLAELIH